VTELSQIVDAKNLSEGATSHEVALGQEVILHLFASADTDGTYEFFPYWCFQHGMDGVKVCYSGPEGQVGPAGSNTSTTTDTAGDCVGGVGWMYCESIDYGDPPDPLPTPDQGGVWNPTLSLNVGAWLRGWLPVNADDVITALDGSLTTAIDNEVTTYVTNHAGDVVGPAITVWLGDNINVVVTQILNNPGALFCMIGDFFGTDVSADAEDSETWLVKGHNYVDNNGVINPTFCMDYAKMFCLDDVPFHAKDATGTDVDGDFVLYGNQYVDEGGLLNPMVLLHAASMFCIDEGPGEDDTFTSSGHRIAGNMYIDEGGRINPITPFPAPGPAVDQVIAGTGGILGIRRDARGFPVEIMDSGGWHPFTPIP
jgi:hypothetical protein